jgi:predicted nucleic acid-binding protein
MTAPVLLDNTVLSNFGQVGRADLPLRLWPRDVCTTSAALDEYLVGVAEGRVPAGAWSDLPQIALSNEEMAIAQHLPVRLGAGELSCLAVAIARSGTLASDDARARRLARERGIPNHRHSWHVGSMCASGLPGT